MRKTIWAEIALNGNQPFCSGGGVTISRKRPFNDSSWPKYNARDSTETHDCKRRDAVIFSSFSFSFFSSSSFSCSASLVSATSILSVSNVAEKVDSPKKKIAKSAQNVHRIAANLKLRNQSI